MKRIACKFTFSTLLAVGVVFLAFMVLSSPSPSRAASAEPDMAATGKASRPDRVEARIKELQTKLKITPAQEELWNNVTRVMRDNATTMEALTKTRSEEASTMTAIDDLKSYAEIVEAHADGIRKFIPAFEPLYAGMSDAQKKAADMLFRHHGRTAKAKAKGK